MTGLFEPPDLGQWIRTKAPAGALSLALLMSFGLSGQQPNVTGNTPDTVNRWYQQMEKYLPEDSTGRFTDFMPTALGCDMILNEVSHKDGSIVDSITLHFGIPCPEVKAKYLTRRGAQPDPGAGTNPNDIKNPFTSVLPFQGHSSPSSGYFPSVSSRDLAAAVTPHAPTGPPAPAILDLPLEPPFAAGTLGAALDGCDLGGFFTYRVNHDDGTVTRIDPCPWQATTTIRVASRPLQAALTPDGKTLVVTSYDNALTFIDTATNTVTGTLKTAQDVFPSGLAITNDGQLACVTSFIDVNPELLIVDLVKRQVAGTIPLGQQFPENVFLSPDNTTAWVVYPLFHQIDVIDTFTGVLSASLTVFSPYGVAFNRTGTLAYVTSDTQSAVLVMDTATLRTVRSFNVGNSPGALFLSPDDRYLLVQNYGSTFFSYIDLTTGVITQVPSGQFDAGTVLLN